jgi:hypothetical protein
MVQRREYPNLLLDTILSQFHPLRVTTTYFPKSISMLPQHLPKWPFFKSCPRQNVIGIYIPCPFIVATCPVHRIFHCHIHINHFPPRRPGFDPRSGHVGFVVDKVALGQVFSEYFGFPYQFSFHRLLHTRLSSGAGTVGQILADVPSGLSLTPPQEKKTINHEVPRYVFFFSYSSSSSRIFRIRPSGLFPIRINLELWSYRQSVGLFGRWSALSQGRYLHRTIQTEETRTGIRASSGIQTHDPSVWAGEAISCLRPRGHCGWLCSVYNVPNCSLCPSRSKYFLGAHRVQLFVREVIVAVYKDINALRKSTFSGTNNNLVCSIKRKNNF